MGFTDLISSSRGPGVIGTGIAFVVLGGFGLLYLLVFDEGLQGGGKTLEGRLKASQVALESSREQLASRKKDLEQEPALKKISDETDKQKILNAAAAKRIPDAQADIEAAKEAVAASEKALADYKDAYRASERGAAIGEERPELKLADGTVYTSVKITKIDNVGMQVVHSGGQKRIPYKLLPEADQVRFQFDEEQQKASSAQESAVAGDLNSSVEIVNLQESIQAKSDLIDTLNAKSESNRKAIAASQVTIPQRRIEIDNYKMAIVQERAKKLSRAPAMEVELKNKQAKLEALVASVPAMQQEIRANESKVSELKGQIETAKKTLIIKVKEKKDASAAPPAGKP